MKITDIGKVLEWASAIYAWDYCDSEPLAELIKNQPIPPVLKTVIAEIIRGDRKQKRKAASKLKIPAREHREIIHKILMRRYSRDAAKLDSEYLGDELIKEPIEIIRKEEEEYRRYLASVAEKYGLETVETLERLVRETKGYLTADDLNQ